MSGSSKLGVLFPFVVISGAWTVPPYYQSFEKASKHEAQLDSVIIEVNGEPRSVKNGEELSFVRGDELLVKKVLLNSPEAKPSITNVVGFVNEGSGSNDLGYKIDTSTELTKKTWALNPEGTVYTVVAYSQRILHGAVFLNRVEPRLEYIDVDINGKTRVMREGEKLLVKKSDSFKVERVVTNLRDNETITFAIVPVIRGEQEAEVPAEKGAKEYRIVFRHKEYTFAKIPMIVEN
ncbi:MAG: hypothetical protein HYW48_00725 [Deltaproteobacteria bacterium]|nr:hypothetical protein [Deltaproteobacteria bacterium]